MNETRYDPYDRSSPYLLKDCEPLRVDCLTCNEPFDTLLVVKDNQPYDYCCSIKCYNEYHSEQNIRDRKLQNLLNSK